MTPGAGAQRYSSIARAAAEKASEAMATRWHTMEPGDRLVASAYVLPATSLARGLSLTPEPDCRRSCAA
jgi:hypothetical protein